VDSAYELTGSDISLQPVRDDSNSDIIQRGSNERTEREAQVNACFV
jgi:hypothetical protein